MNTQFYSDKVARFFLTSLVGLFSFVVLLQPLYVSALAGFAEQVYRYEYSPGLRLHIGAPSDMCPAEYGNQRCMWVGRPVYSSTSSETYFRSPTFISISDLFNGYIAGQSYNTKQWIVYNTKTDKIDYTTDSEAEIRTKIKELGGTDNLYSLQQVKDHFKKVKVPFNFVSLIFILIPLVIFIGIPAGIIFVIYKIIRKLFYRDKKIPSNVVDVPVTTPLQPSVPTEPEMQASEVVTLATVAQSSSPTSSSISSVPLPDKKQEYKTIASVIFILIAFTYLGNYLMSSTSEFSLASLFPKDKAPGGKALLRKITNKAVIKDVKSLTELHEKEGLLKDNLAVYRCNFIVDTFSDCAVQDVVKHPETFVRISNIYGQDSGTVYVLDGDSNRYKVFSKPEYKTFRSYFDPNESHYGLYSWDDHQIFKGEKVIRGSSSSTLSTTTPALKTNYNAFRSTFYKQYYKGDVAGPRNPYQGITQMDGNIQFASDGEYIYHGDGRSSATSDSIYVFKVNEADLATFQPYLQKMMGTSYLKYATDKSQVFCDNVRVDEEGYPVSDGLTIIKDPNPKSFQVIYPTSAITVRNADVQVAKTDTQVFVNCAPQTNIDARTLTGSEAGLFGDKNGEYVININNSSTTNQKAYLTVRQPNAIHRE